MFELVQYSVVTLLTWLVLQLVLTPIRHALIEIRALVQSKVDRDWLTGFWNRFALQTTLELIMEKPPELPISVIMVDIDRFKNVIRNHGQDVADHLICNVAQQINALVDRRDFVCRYDREQFIILLLDIDGIRAQQKAEAIRERIAQYQDVEHPDTAITASLGVCDIRGLPERTPKAILSAVQEATYMAKRAGRNRVFRGDAFIRRFPLPPKIN